MKYLITIALLISLYSCTDKHNKSALCSNEIEQKYCDLFCKAKWTFYASNSVDSISYLDSKNNKISKVDALFMNLQLSKLIEKGDTVEFQIFPSSEYGVHSFKQKNYYYIFGVNKKTKQLLYRLKGNTKGYAEKVNGNVFFKNDKVYKYIDSLYKNSDSPINDMRMYGTYPLDELDSILISKIKAGRFDINPWVTIYAKEQGLVY